MCTIANPQLPVFPLFESAFVTAATFVRARLLGVLQSIQVNGP